MKKLLALLLVLCFLLPGCTRSSSEVAEETETTQEILPEAAVSVPVIYLRVAYATEDGFVGLTVPKPGDRMQEGKEINIVIEDGVETCVPVDDKTGKFLDAKEVTYEPGMLLSVHFTKWDGNTIYPELMYEHDTLWWEEENTWFSSIKRREGEEE